jgi:hypothetical protein
MGGVIGLSRAYCKIGLGGVSPPRIQTSSLLPSRFSCVPKNREGHSARLFSKDALRALLRDAME